MPTFRWGVPLPAGLRFVTLLFLLPLTVGCKGGSSQIVGLMGVESQIARLTDSAPEIRRAAAWSLGRAQDSRAVEPLIARLQDEDLEVRWKAAQALGEIRDARAVDALSALLSVGNYDGSREAAVALGKIGDQRATSALIECLQTAADGHVRAAAAFALGQLKDRRAIRPLITALVDEGGAGRFELQVLTAIVGTEVTSTLVEALADADPEIRASAAFGLGLIDEARVVRPLLAASEDRYTNVRSQAVDALRKTSTASLGASLAEMEPQERARAETTLRRLHALSDQSLRPGELPVPKAGLAHAIGRIAIRGKGEKGVPIYLHSLPNSLAYEPNTWTDDGGNWAVLNIRPGSYLWRRRHPNNEGPCLLPGFCYNEGEVKVVQAGTVTDFSR